MRSWLVAAVVLVAAAIAPMLPQAAANSEQSAPLEVAKAAPTTIESLLALLAGAGGDWPGPAPLLHLSLDEQPLQRRMWLPLAPASQPVRVLLSGLSVDAAQQLRFHWPASTPVRAAFAAAPPARLAAGASPAQISALEEHLLQWQRHAAAQDGCQPLEEADPLKHEQHLRHHLRRALAPGQPPVLVVDLDLAAEGVPRPELPVAEGVCGDVVLARLVLGLPVSLQPLGLTLLLALALAIWVGPPWLARLAAQQHPQHQRQA